MSIGLFTAARRTGNPTPVYLIYIVLCFFKYFILTASFFSSFAISFSRGWYRYFVRTKVPWKKFPRKEIPRKRCPIKKSTGKHSLLKESPHNLLREVENFFNFYRLIPPGDPTHTTRCLTLTLAHMPNCGKRAPGDLFFREFFSGDIFVCGFFSRGRFFPGFELVYRGWGDEKEVQTVDTYLLWLHVRIVYVTTVNIQYTYTYKYNLCNKHISVANLHYLI